MGIRILFAAGLSGLVAACASAEPVAVLADGTQVVGRSFAPSAEDGAVTLECILAEGGLLTNCVVISETPSGRGLGEAGLAMSRRGLRVKADPNSIGQKVRFTSRFRLEN